MLNRRYLRVKVLQSLYAFLMNENDDLAEGEKLLLLNLKKLYELLIYQFSLIIEIVDFAEKRQEDAKSKFFPTEEELAPSMRFVENRFIRQFRANRSFQRYLEAYKINWGDEHELIRKIFIKINKKDFFRDYKTNPVDNYFEDKEIIVKIIQFVFLESKLLEEFYGDKSIYWTDNYYTANILLIKTINIFEESFDEYYPLPELFESNEDQDRLFMIDLFRKTDIHNNEFREIIEKNLTNWDFDRLAYMDILMLKMAICEFLYFPSIPIKVTLNEYIEISKFFSTPKSKLFINGILDKIAVDFQKDKLTQKSGRGLL